MILLIRDALDRRRATAGTTLRGELRERHRLRALAALAVGDARRGALALLLFFGPMEVLLPYLVRNELGGGAGHFGLVLAADGVGAIVGVVMHEPARRLPRRYMTRDVRRLWALATLPLVGYALGDRGLAAHAAAARSTAR